MDVFVSADAEIVDDLIRRELLVEESRLVFARGQLSLVARSNGLAPDSGLSALDASKVERLAIPSAAVPLGRYARSWLASRGLLDQFEGRIVVTEHARATLAAVDAGHVDLAIVYRSDLRLAKAAVTLASIDPSEYPPIRYVAARTARAPDCPEIGETIAAWGQPPMQEELARAGFLLADRSGGVE